MSISVRQATIEDVDAVAPLFDAYRVFYRRPSDLAAARSFLLDRFRRRESIIFLALTEPANDAPPVGFTQLYPSFSSVSMAPIFVLNDLYVDPAARRTGVAEALLAAAARYGRLAGAVRLTLSTELTNRSAQALYEKAGWQRDDEFCVYTLAL